MFQRYTPSGKSLARQITSVAGGEKTIETTKNIGRGNGFSAQSAFECDIASDLGPNRGGEGSELLHAITSGLSAVMGSGRATSRRS
jgi:hypothetical protein